MLRLLIFPLLTLTSLNAMSKDYDWYGLSIAQAARCFTISEALYKVTGFKYDGAELDQMDGLSDHFKSIGSQLDDRDWHTAEHYAYAWYEGVVNTMHFTKSDFNQVRTPILKQCVSRFGDGGFSIIEIRE